MQQLTLLLCADENYRRPMINTLLSALAGLAPNWRAKIYLGQFAGDTTAEVAAWRSVRMANLGDKIAAIQTIRVDPTGRLAALSPRPDLPRSAFLRFFALNQLPVIEQRVIYLDCDILVRCSLHELWQQPFNTTIAAVPDAGAEILLRRRDYELIQGRTKAPLRRYFNSGVLLVDLTKWRATRATHRVLGILEKNRLSHCDQDAINIVFQKSGEITALDPTYNWQFWHRRDWLMHLGSGLFSFLKRRRTPAIIHYVERPKPWLATADGLYVRQYRRFLQEVCGIEPEAGAHRYDRPAWMRRGSVIWYLRANWAKRSWLGIAVLALPATILLVLRLKEPLWLQRRLWPSWLIAD